MCGRVCSPWVSDRGCWHLDIFKELVNPHDPGSVFAILVLLTAHQLHKVSKTHLMKCKDVGYGKCQTTFLKRECQRLV